MSTTIDYKYKSKENYYTITLRYDYIYEPPTYSQLMEDSLPSGSQLSMEVISVYPDTIEEDDYIWEELVEGTRLWEKLEDYCIEDYFNYR